MGNVFITVADTGFKIFLVADKYEILIKLFNHFAFLFLQDSNT